MFERLLTTDEVLLRLVAGRHLTLRLRWDWWELCVVTIHPKKDVTGRISYVRNRKIMENIRIHQVNIVRY